MVKSQKQPEHMLKNTRSVRPARVELLLIAHMLTAYASGD